MVTPPFHAGFLSPVIFDLYEVNDASVHAALPLHHALPDPDDAPFLEVALAAGAAGVITGNLKHYPARCREGLRVFSPAEFVEYFRRNR